MPYSGDRYLCKGDMLPCVWYPDSASRVVIASAGDFENAVGPYNHAVLTYHVAREFAPDSQYIHVPYANTTGEGLSNVEAFANMRDLLLAVGSCVYWGSISFPHFDELDRYLEGAPTATVLLHDIKTGWGIPILPAPEAVNIGRYSPGRETNMQKTNTGLVDYCKAQLGRPYWMGTFGQIATPRLYEYNKSRLPEHYTANDFSSQYGKRVHDCIGLVKGYLWSDSANNVPSYNGAQDYSADAIRAACTEKGGIGTLPELPVTLVFSSGHVGVYIGNGEVIEARGHAYGVVKTRLSQRGWTHWGKCPFINYEEEEEMTNSDGAEWSKTSREWTVKNGLFEGKGTDQNGKTIYGWNDGVTRQELAVVFYRLAKLIGKVWRQTS